jgi:hypothetical protein
MFSKQLDGPHKQAGEATFISDKIDFRLKSVKRDNEGHFILIKGTINQEEISVLNIYAPNSKVPNYIIKTLTNLRAQMDPNAVIV